MNFDLLGMFSIATTEIYFSCHKSRWIAATDYYMYFWYLLNCANSIDGYTPINK